MRKVQRPPVQIPLLDSRGLLNSVWVRWFDSMAVQQEYNKRTPDLRFTTDATLTTDDFGKLIVFDCTSSDLTCSLMPASQRDLNGWLTLYRMGSGKFSVRAGVDDEIEYSSKGGTIWCDEKKRRAANLTLEIVDIGLWAITGATGLWKFR